jgi:hypothetical protein
MNPGRTRFDVEIKMIDLLMLAFGLAFFGLTVAYTFACDRL